jgi:hypothetical protein
VVTLDQPRPDEPLRLIEREMAITFPVHAKDRIFWYNMINIMRIDEFTQWH